MIDARMIAVWAGVLVVAVGCVPPYEPRSSAGPSGWTAPAYRAPVTSSFQDHVTWETDEFTGVDKRVLDVVLEDVGAGDTKLFEIAALTARVSSNTQIRIQIHNMRSSRFGGWRYMNCHGLAFLIDGQPFPLAGAEYKSRMSRGGASSSAILGEVIYVDDRYDLLNALLVARRVQGRLCNDVFELEPSQLAMMHDFLERLEAEMATQGHGWRPQEIPIEPQAPVPPAVNVAPGATPPATPY